MRLSSVGGAHIYVNHRNCHRRPYIILPLRAVQRSVLSPKCNTIQRSEAQREVEDSVGGKSLNLCEATESFGGRLEVVRTSSFALWDDSRPASRRGQTLSVTSRAVVLRFRHG